MNLTENYLPGWGHGAINRGPWLTHYSLPELQQRCGITGDGAPGGCRYAVRRLLVPIVPLGTPWEQITAMVAADSLLLPPLWACALDEHLEARILQRIRACFPVHELALSRGGYSQRSTVSEAGRYETGNTSVELDVVRMPKGAPDSKHVLDARLISSGDRPRILALSVDTAVEEHGPHLPLATDTIQSYAVLNRLLDDVPGMVVAPPVDYGHLTWGLPFGMSIDLTPPLLTEYCTAVINAWIERLHPDAVYVVDVHGSIVHRNAIVAGIEQSHARLWKFRWLHEPLVEFAGDRGDQHAGAVETALVEYINSNLVDSNWFPARIDELAAGQMSLGQAVELTPDLPRFIDTVAAGSFNGIVGNINNYHQLDAGMMFNRMLDVARRDLSELRDLSGRR